MRGKKTFGALALAGLVAWKLAAAPQAQVVGSREPEPEAAPAPVAPSPAPAPRRHVGRRLATSFAFAVIFFAGAAFAAGAGNQLAAVDAGSTTDAAIVADTSTDATTAAATDPVTTTDEVTTTDTVPTTDTVTTTAAAATTAEATTTAEPDPSDATPAQPAAAPAVSAPAPAAPAPAAPAPAAPAPLHAVRAVRRHAVQRAAAVTRAPATAPVQSPFPVVPFDPQAWLTDHPGSPAGNAAVAIAEGYLGVPYRWGGNTPASGFDCSGLTQYVYAQLGVWLPHYAAAQFLTYPRLAPSDLEPGDLVFFEPKADGPGHVAIYAGNGEIVEAPHTGATVRIGSLAGAAASLGFLGAVRPTAQFAAASSPVPTATRTVAGWFIAA